MNRLFIFPLFIFSLLTINCFCQVNNSDPNRTYINVNTPETPESAGFDKYGAPRVNEFTGTVSVDIPLYTLQSQFLQLPITLSYQATGIKVNQEASWVGLGWDLNAGGRITVEIKGSADFNSSTRGLSSPTNLASGMQRIFNRLYRATESGENAVLTPSTLCEDGSSGCLTDTNFDNLAALQEMTEFGTGEPDIFRANFIGHSLTFFIDKISHTVRFIGEQSFFKINYTLDTYNNITNWTLVDDDGITYYFNQPENTTFTLPSNAVTPASTTTAWLLTKIVHPTGDYIQFSYNNYGYTVPAFTMSGWVDWNVNVAGATLSNDQNQNIALQSPYYLTKIETSNTEVDFSLGNRTDLYSATNASKKLDQIKVLDKTTGNTVKTATFNYSYFQSSTNHNTYLDNLSYYLPSPLTTHDYLACSNSRLRLDGVNINLGTYQPSYSFYYNSLIPNKYDYGQDHWGYYNAVYNDNNGASFTHLIPYSGTAGVGNSIPAIDLNTSLIGFSRDCNPSAVQAMMLTSVVYPTGGSSSFTYEPHQSTMAPTTPITGGGVRVKAIQNYESGNLVNTTSYSYSGGKYMGIIKYFTNADMLDCSGSGLGGDMKYSSEGAINFNDILIGYGQITVAQTGASARANGFVTKTFNINTPSSNYSNEIGFDLVAPYFPSGESHVGISGETYDHWLDPRFKAFPPTPSANLEGKLMQEQYFDSLNNLIKAVNYYYHLANYSNSFYDIIAIQNRRGGFSGCTNGGFETGGLRPVNLFVSPAKSYHTLTDSVLELVYSGSNFVKKKTTYQYNSHYQPMFESVYNSDGTQTIHYTRTSAEIYVPGGGGYSGTIANQMYQMYNQHVLNAPIEQTVIHLGTAGDSSVISSHFNVYQNALPYQVYVMESQSPLAFRTQFVPWYYSASSPYSVNIDGHYVQYSSADFSSNNMISTLHTLTGNKAYIWDDAYNTVLAQCTNADISNIAFTSFETLTKGRWTYNQSGVTTDNTAPTGGKAYNLATANITLGSLSSSTTYIVSYWTKSASSYSVTGGTSVKKGRTVNGWTYYEHTVTNASTVGISGSGYIDEVRLYPASAQMSTYTYSPLVGITSECDVSSKINYYFYDAIGRLEWIKDQDGNIVKTFQYHYSGLAGIQY